MSHNFYLFGGNDERSQDLIQGFTAWGGFFDEAPIMPQSFVDMAISRLSIEGATVWFTNPLNPGAHWFKKDFIDRAQEKGLLYLHLTMDDNLSLSEKVKARYRSLFTGVFFRRYILGEWCAAEGAYLSRVRQPRGLGLRLRWELERIRGEVRRMRLRHPKCSRCIYCSHGT